MDVSIIIPCRKESDTIKKCINSIVNQTGMNTSYSCEVIVACATDDEKTICEVRKICSENNIVKLIYNKKNITAAGINLGIKASKGRYIAIIGAHSIIEKDYILECLNVIKHTDADNVGGPWQAYGEDEFEKLLAKVFNTPVVFGFSKSHDINYEGYTDSVWGGFYKRDVFEKIGLFDEELIRNSDDEFNKRLIKYGGKIYQSKRIRFKYKVRSSLKKLYLQFYQYGYYRIFTIIKNRKSIKARQLAPVIFINSFIIMLVVLILNNKFLLLAIIMSLVISLITGISVKIDLKNKFEIFKIITTICIGYGIGQEIALINYVFKNKPKRFISSR